MIVISLIADEVNIQLMTTDYKYTHHCYIILTPQEKYCFYMTFNFSEHSALPPILARFVTKEMINIICTADIWNHKHKLYKLTNNHNYTTFYPNYPHTHVCTVDKYSIQQCHVTTGTTSYWFFKCKRKFLSSILSLFFLILTNIFINIVLYFKLLHA